MEDQQGHATTHDHTTTGDSVTMGDKATTATEQSSTTSPSSADDPTRVLQREPPTTAGGMISVPVPLTSSDVDEEPTGAKKAKDTVLGGLKKLRGDKATAVGKVKVLRMSKEDYARYWAKDDDGNYIGTEPEGEGRKLWAEELKESD